MGADELGFCGLRIVRSEGGAARLLHLAGTVDRGLLQWYRDPLPTNCVADWVCAGSRQPGRHNLAVFYASCTLDCLFCQNWHFRESHAEHDRGMSAAALADRANADTYCVCFFGGDPASQMPHALAAARMLAKRGVRACWETAGTQHPAIMNQAVELSLKTGGTVKFDLKAHDPRLHAVLTGADNARTLANFARAAKRARERPEWPLVVASTLLVPGYVTADEVERIARFIAEIDPDVPYALLAFAPQFLFGDLPRTSRRDAEDARQAALSAGLRNVRLGNQHLLW
jgi:pyruvate formate lyase activating enzyme